MENVQDLLMEACKVIRLYGVIVYDENVQDQMGSHRKMILTYEGKDYFIRMTNGNITCIRVV